MSSSSSSSSSLQYLRPEVAQLKAKLDHFIETRVIPAESEFHQHLQQRHGTNRFTIDAVPSCVERLKQEAKELGLWNLFIPPRLLSHVPDPTLKPKIPLSYREYGILCESMVRTVFFFLFFSGLCVEQLLIRVPGVYCSACFMFIFMLWTLF